MNRRPLLLALATAAFGCAHPEDSTKAVPPAPTASVASVADGGVDADVGVTARMTVVPQKPLIGLPDAFEPNGERVGKRTKESCDVWDVVSGLYRGQFARAVCDEWMTHVGHAAGRKVRAEGTAVVVEREAGGVIARLEGCWAKPTALTISPSGEKVAAFCSSRAYVWSVSTGRLEDIELDDRIDRPNWTLAFSNDQLLVAASDEPRLRNASAATLRELAGLFDASFVKVRLATKAVEPDSSGLWKLDPFGHFVFRASVGCEEGCFEDVRVESLDGRAIHLEWQLDASAKETPVPMPERTFADDGSACLVRARAASAPQVSAGVALVAKDGAETAPLFGSRYAIAPNGRRMAALVAPGGDELGSLDVLGLTDDGPPTRRSIALPDASRVKDLVFSDDGSVIAAELPDRVTLYDAASGRVLLFWEGVKSPAFARAQPHVVFAQRASRSPTGEEGTVVVRRRFGAAEAGAPPLAPLEGRLLRGSLANGQPMLLSQKGTVAAYDASGAALGTWPIDGTAVAFGPGGLAAVVSEREVVVLALGRSGAVGARIPASGLRRARFVARELWTYPVKGEATRWDVDTGTKLGPVTLAPGDEPSPDGSIRCGDVVTRKDGATLLVVGGTLVSEAGTYQGPRAGGNATALRAPGDPLTAPLLRGGALPETTNLVHDFFVGATLLPPFAPPVVPQILRFAVRIDGQPQTTTLRIAARGKTEILDDRDTVLATIDDSKVDGPLPVHHLSFPGPHSVRAQACVGEICTPQTPATWESEPTMTALDGPR